MNRLAVSFAFCWLCATTHAADQTVDYVTQVKPILAAKCFSCHGALKQESGLRLDASTLIRKGGDSGPVIIVGKAAGSLLIDRVTAADIDQRMPPHGEGEPLSAQQILVVKRWIDQGAAAPKELIPANPRDHWAYQPLRRERFSSSAETVSAHNFIDAILAARHEQVGLRRAPQARKEILLRRLYLDLIGLPPTPKDLRTFLSDHSADAYQRVVDRLLESPQYGERWGRHWMDVWRYSDWAGFGKEIRYSQRHIWRWRNWIVESLNRDKGYDRMILEMLAADELMPSDENAIRATGFLARNWYKFDRNVWLDDTIEHTGRAFLGMTLKCARCHDHKYDPISQREYYRFRAIFEPYDVRIDRVPGDSPSADTGLARVYDAKPAQATHLFERGDPKRPDKQYPVHPGVPSVIRSPFKINPVPLPLAGYYPALRPSIVRDSLTLAWTQVESAKRELHSAKERKLLLEQSLAKQQVPADIAATSVAESSVPKSKPKSKPQEAPSFLEDEFHQARPDTWRFVRGRWEYADGHLTQKQIVAGFSPMATLRDHPRDFSATLDFKPTGGNVYRSVGLSFDWIDDRDFQAVYLSAKNSGSTVSAFHRRDGRDVYPSQAIVSQAIKVGQRTKLEVLVRGDILNVKVDGKLKLAYQLPMARSSGKFAIWTYDATAVFYGVRVAELPASVALLPPGDVAGIGTVPADSESRIKAVAQAVALSEAKVRLAQSKWASIEARIAAERAAHRVGTLVEQAEKGELAKAAAKAERLAALADADVKLLSATHEFDRARDAAEQSHDTKSKQAVDAARKKFATAQSAREKLRKAAASSSYQPLGAKYPQTSSGRRLALARWIVDSRNPLTARVAVNHIWLRHFGAPLVENVDDFGLRSAQPPLADLLDRLAVELVQHRWSMKHLHRLIVNSSSYQLSSSVRPAHPSREKDPDNTLFWRFNRRRMEAEVVRDAVLHVAGNLDLNRGGPDIDHKQGLTVPRRSLYFRHARERQMEFLRMFDPANPRECYRRLESIRPQQAFALVNSSLTLAHSRTLASQLAKEASVASDDEKFIVASFETVLSRRPGAAELKQCRQFLVRQTQLLADPGRLQLLGTAANAVPAAADPTQRARENLVLVLFNHNDFVTIR